MPDCFHRKSKSGKVLDYFAHHVWLSCIRHKGDLPIYVCLSVSLLKIKNQNYLSSL